MNDYKNHGKVVIHRSNFIAKTLVFCLTNCGSSGKSQFGFGLQMNVQNKQINGLEILFNFDYMNI